MMCSAFIVLGVLLLNPCEVTAIQLEPLKNKAHCKVSIRFKNGDVGQNFVPETCDSLKETVLNSNKVLDNK